MQQSFLFLWIYGCLAWGMANTFALVNINYFTKPIILEPMHATITCGCKQDKVNNLITLSKLEQIYLK